jgi:hypothetical protein
MAGEPADVIALSGLGRTLPDGYGHEARWRLDQFEAQLTHVGDGARQRNAHPALEVLVQLVRVTDDPEAEVTDSSAELGVPVADLLAVPFLWSGQRMRSWQRFVTGGDGGESAAWFSGRTQCTSSSLHGCSIRLEVGATPRRRPGDEPGLVIHASNPFVCNQLDRYVVAQAEWPLAGRQNLDILD